MVLNMNVIQSTVSDVATVEMQVMRRENEALQKWLVVLGGKGDRCTGQSGD